MESVDVFFICYWRFHCRSISNLLTVNSCIAYLVFVIAVSNQIPCLFQSNEQQNNSRITTLCKIRGFLVALTSITKVLSYLAQAISRYFITVLYKHKKLLTYRVNVIVIILNWIFGIIISSGFLISPVAFQYEPESRLCTLTSRVFFTSFSLTTIGFVIPVNIIVIL